MKRIFDFLFALVGLIILAPLFAIIAVLILIDSPGSIFYSQNRVGLNSKEFKLYKFRTMKCGSDKFGLLTVGTRDQRITNIGFFLRKFKLDELPQLINVLLGDMSLVGPRPEVRKYVNYYSEEQRKVLNVRPGITDWASIKYIDENEIIGLSSNPEEYYINYVMPEKLALNLRYINRNDLFVDFKIILLTIERILIRRFVIKRKAKFSSFFNS